MKLYQGNELKCCPSRASQTRDRRGNRAIRVGFSAGLVVLGAILAASLQVFVSGSNDMKALQTFNDEAILIARSVELSVRNFMTATSILKTLLDVNGDDDRDTFQALANNLDKSIDVLSYQYIPKVSHSDRKGFELEAQDYWRERLNVENKTFPIIGKFASGFETMPDRDDYFPIKFVEPADENVAIINLDVSTASDKRRASITSAYVKGKPVADGPHQLVQDSDPNVLSILIQYPLKDKFAIVLSVVRTHSMIRRAVTTLADGLVLNMYVDGEPLGTFRGPNASISSLMCITCFDDEPFLYSYSFRILERNWTILVAASSHYSPPSYTASALPVFMVVFFLVLAVLYLLSLQQEDKQSLALERQAAEQAKKESGKIAEAERQLNDYIAHEVRNPLSVAISANQFIRGTLDGVIWPTAESKCTANEDNRLVDAQLRSIHDLLDNILDLNKFSQGSGSLKLAMLSLRKDVFAPVQTVLRRSFPNLSFSVHMEEPDIVVHGDALRLRQMVLNLAKNSAMFVQKGFIRTTAKRLSNGLTQIAVEDSGQGIADDAIPVLFKKYSESLDTVQQGAGIGTCLCKVLVEAMGGTIHLDRSYKSPIEGCPGARFVLEIPFEESNETLVKINEAEASVHGTYKGESSSIFSTIMVIDDGQPDRKIICRQLGKRYPDATFIEMSSGEDALAYIHENMPNTVDLFIVDHYMPGLNAPLRGDEVIRHLRSSCPTSIIVGHSSSDIQQQHLTAGANLFIPKPLPDAATLHEMLSEAWLKVAAFARVIIADDEAINARVLERTLKKIAPKLEIHKVTTGEKVIELVAQMSTDLVVLDEHMGDGMTGTECSQKLRESGFSGATISVSGGSVEVSSSAFDLVWSKPLPPMTDMKKDLIELLSRRK